MNLLTMDEKEEHVENYIEKETNNPWKENLN